MESKSSWVCPNDRELTLRARYVMDFYLISADNIFLLMNYFLSSLTFITYSYRLETGWSVKSNQLQGTTTKHEQINESEQDIILKVILKAQQIEQIEKERIK
jgi:hypothetical protein